MAGHAVGPVGKVVQMLHDRAFAREPRAITERLWRLRKDHRVIEALTRTPVGSDAVTLTIDYNGEARSVSRWPSYQLATEEARMRLREFQRQGWATHW